MNSDHRAKVLRPLIECGALRSDVSFSGKEESVSGFFDTNCLDEKALEVVGRELMKIVWDVFFFIGKQERKFDIFLAVEREGILLAKQMSAALSGRCSAKIPVLSYGTSGPKNENADPAAFKGKRVLLIGDYIREETVSAVSALLGRGAKPEGLVLLFEGGEKKNKIPALLLPAQPAWHKFLIRSVISSKDMKIYYRMRENREKRTARSRSRA